MEADVVIMICENGFVSVINGENRVHTNFADLIAHLEEELEIDNDQRVLTKKEPNAHNNWADKQGDSPTNNKQKG